MAGQHHRNPRAIMAAQPVPKFPQGTEVLGFQFEAVLELTKEKLAEAKAIIDEAEARGQDPRTAVPNWNPTEQPEYFDYVVYNRPSLGRPSPLLPDPRQVPTAFIRYSEHLRIPLVELRKRADAAFAAKESPEKVH